ncbi:unnamed protein product [Caenorhabditis auriculariae]|uniref:Acid ceramidase N-terminal domain-containing protein n=1 Tax=Caenorhabditis auriculariae TaxID=2777116 RepID=A0A8S1H2V4_9PELO|nr:unnamed protein product [Caenorhabditis auriculariae]
MALNLIHLKATSARINHKKHLRMKVLLLLWTSLATVILADEHPVRRFTVDLDRPPSERWNDVIDAHLDAIPAVVAEAKSEQYGGQLVQGWASDLTWAWSPLDNELRIETLWMYRPRQPRKSSSKFSQRGYSRAQSLRLATGGVV